MKSVGDSVNIEIDSMTQTVVDTVKRVMIKEEDNEHRTSMWIISQERGGRDD